MVLETVVAVVMGTTVDPAYVNEGRLLLPLDVIARAIGAEVKMVEEVGEAFCKGDLCIPLSTGGQNHTAEVEGTVYVYVDVLSDALAIDVRRTKEGYVLSEGREQVGVAAGDRAPTFSLPDLHTGEMVSSADYLGKKTVFYAWASW